MKRACNKNNNLLILITKERVKIPLNSDKLGNLW